MFPKSHAFVFGVTAYQAAWMKYYYPLEFYMAIFNQQPMGFYNLETLKEDARMSRCIGVLNPDINRNEEKCIPEGNALRLGFLSVDGVGEVAAKAIVEALHSVWITLKKLSGYLLAAIFSSTFCSIPCQFGLVQPPLPPVGLFGSI